MKIEKDDMIVMEVNGKKELVVVTHVDKKGKVFGHVSNRDCVDSATKKLVEFRPDAAKVYANAGPDREKGSAFGKKIEPFIDSFKLPYWGHVAIFREMSPPETKRLRTALKNVSKKLEKLGLIGLLNVEVNVFPPRGKYAGTYGYKGVDKDGIHKEDKLTLFPQDFSNIEELLWHEMGHFINFRCIPQYMYAKWIDFFKVSLDTQQAGDNQLTSMYKGIIKEAANEGSDFTLRGYRGQLDEDDANLLSEIIQHISSMHHLIPMHIELLLAHGSDVKEYWPKTIELQSLNPIITEYATSSPEELFAETSRYYFTGQELPKKLRKLWKETMKTFIKGSAPVREEEDDEDDNEPAPKSKSVGKRAAARKKRGKKGKK